MFSKHHWIHQSLAQKFMIFHGKTVGLVLVLKMNRVKPVFSDLLKDTVVGKNDERFAHIGLVYRWWIPWWNSVKRNHQLNTQKSVELNTLVISQNPCAWNYSWKIEFQVLPSSQWPFWGVLSDLFRSESRDLHLGGFAWRTSGVTLEGWFPWLGPLWMPQGGVVDPNHSCILDTFFVNFKKKLWSIQETSSMN